jgi:hypothetical protein
MRIPKSVGTPTAMLVLTVSTVASAQVVTSGVLDPRGSWNLVAPGISASGGFVPGNTPEGNFNAPLFSGQFVDTSWTSGSVDGFGGTMILNGTSYGLASSDIATAQSTMDMSAGGFSVDHAGTYQEPFTFGADFCGWIAGANPGPCDANASVSGSGMVRMVVDPYDMEGHFFIESISYNFGATNNVPEPASLGLLVMGIGLIGCRRRLARR